MYCGQWNLNSPHNVKIISIDELIEELCIDLDNNTLFDINDYKICTFSTKEDLKLKRKKRQEEMILH